jgi:hypothetical protein
MAASHLPREGIDQRPTRKSHGLSPPNGQPERDSVELIAIIEVVAYAYSIRHPSQAAPFMPLQFRVRLVDHKLDDRFAHPGFALADQAQ